MKRNVVAALAGTCAAALLFATLQCGSSGSDDGQGAPDGAGSSDGSGIDGGNDAGSVDAGPVPGIPCEAGCACTILATGQDEPTAVAADANNVYWVTFGTAGDGNVMQASLSTGAITTLAKGQSGARSIAIDAKNVYWATISGDCDAGTCAFDTGTVNAVPIGGGPTKVLASGQAAPAGMAVDATRVYWVNEGTPPANTDGAVMAAPIDGATPAVPIVTPVDNPFGVTIDATNVYWTSNQDDVVKSMPLIGGVQKTIASGQDNIYQVVVDSKNAYWWAYSYTSSPGIHYMMSAPLDGGDGGAGTAIASDVLADTLAIDATNLYWADFSEGLIVSLALGGGSPKTLCDQQGSPQGLAVTPRGLFWGVVGQSPANDGRIVYLAK